MIGNWFSDLFGGEQTLNAISTTLISSYVWAKEWQVLLAGLLVVIAALIIARAIRKALAGPGTKSSSLDDVRLDLRLEPRPAARPIGQQDRSGQLVGELEQLRSLIRSALSAFTLTAERENSPVQFLCQRVARLRPDRYPLSPGAAKAQHDLYTALLEQLEVLRQQLKREAKPVEISATLVQLNTSARNLVAELASQATSRRQAGS
jgi:hypothetical protein